MKARYLINSLIALLWVMTISCTLVSMSFVFFPGSVDRIDHVLREAFLYKPASQLEQILKDNRHDQNPANFQSALEELLVQLEQIQRVDQNSNIKRAAFRELVISHMNQGQLDEARRTTDAWIAFNPRDVTAILYRARTLYLNPGTREEGENQLLLMKERFPNSLTVADEIATTYASNGELGKAFLVYKPFLPSNVDRRKRIIGQTLSNFETSFSPGDKLVPFALTFIEGESVQVSVEKTPQHANVLFTNKGFIKTDYGYLKQPSSGLAELRLESIDSTSPVQLKVTVTIPVPQTLTLLTDARFRALVQEQLIDTGNDDAWNSYERFTQT